MTQSFGCDTELWFWQPLQPWFVKETAFFFAKAQNLRIRLAPNSWDSYAGFFVAQSFVLASKKPSLVQLPCAKTREFGEAEFSDCLPVSCFTNAVCQNCKKLRFLRQFAGFRFGAFLVVQEWGWRTSRGMFCVVFMWFLRGCGAGLGARGSRVFVSFFIYFICSPSNNFLFFYSV